MYLIFLPFTLYIRVILRMLKGNGKDFDASLQRHIELLQFYRSLDSIWFIRSFSSNVIQFLREQ